jgi:hypothetical protein
MLRLSPVLALVALLAQSSTVVAQNDPGFDVEEFQRLEGDMQAADLVRQGMQEGETDWIESTWAAIDIRRNLIAFLQSALARGTMDPGTAEYAENARLILMENVVALLVDIGECDAASRAADLIGDGEHQEEVFRRAHDDAQINVATCRPHERDVSAQDASVPPPEEEGDVLGPILMGLGATALIVGVALDLDTSAKHDEFVALREEYETTGSNDTYSEVESLKDTIDGRPPLILSLYAAGAGLTIAGLLVILSDSGDEEPGEMTWLPIITPEQLGVRLTF